ncbi:glycopeptide [Dichomitus squalens]|uniref:Glycopeptide n=1 Tax=Dichomitus squalens TaxID=114155 RepID=A0A4Q9MRA0_9APHY|nr:glycopeptide [Dichomitus squalens]
MHFSFITSLVAVATIFGSAMAESHTVHFNNQCGHGTPTLVQNGKILSTGNDFVSNGPLISAIAYLQTGSCGLDGEGCTLVEATLKNPTTPGSGSSADISLIPPHTFSVTSGFVYSGGCDGVGADCKDANCPDAFHDPNQTGVQKACQVDNVNLDITFCD